MKLKDEHNKSQAASKGQKATGWTIFFFCLLSVACSLSPFLSFGAGPAPKKEKGPPTMHGIILPVGAVRLQDIAGSASYRVPDSVQNLEKAIKAMFVGAKDVTVTTRTIGGSQMVIFENHGQRPWSSIQVSGIIGENVCYLVISGTHPDEIDKFK